VTSRPVRPNRRVWGGAALLVSVALLIGCGPDGRGSSPFCGDWGSSSEGQQEGIVRGEVEQWLRSSRAADPPNVNFVKCVGTYVLDRRGAITEACELYGDLEAGITIGGLVSAGVRACLEIDQLRGP
jgi:hypothetical protein